MDHLMNTYRRLPVTFERGEGVYLFDTEGNQYLDALCGIGLLDSVTLIHRDRSDSTTSNKIAAYFQSLSN